MELNRDAEMTRALNRELGIAEQQRDAGIAQAVAATEREHIGWTELGYAYLLRHARAHRVFTSEQVADSAQAWGLIEPKSPRCWGAVYLRAARAGLIRKVGTGIALRRHRSPCPLWQSNIYTAGKR